MITDAFDNLSPAIINPVRKDNAPEVNACIVTFSHEIEKHVADHYACGEIASLWCATGKCTKYILFGGAGCLNREIAHGKVMVPTAAYRDEGTSYHYAPAADYVAIRNSRAVAECMKANGIPYVLGKTWTTDSFYRETRNNFEKRKADGCISVEMECAGVQAMCDFRGLELYPFFTSGDLLDAPEWDERGRRYSSGGQHDPGHFDIALALADFVSQE